jgi:transposase
MKAFKPYDPDQQFLLPPDLRSWLPENHLALFISDVVDTLHLSEILGEYEQGDGRGQPPYHPAMMVKVILYAYATGKPSSRKIEKATWEDIPFRVLAANQHPDHDSIAAFRKRHLQSLSRLFLQVLQICREAGLVKLGHVSLDGTKMKANASKRKAMSYGRMCEAEKKLEEEVRELLAQAERADEEEDKKYGKGKRGDELPEELARREGRLKKIREAKAALEAEARRRAEEKAQEAQAKIEERRKKEEETGKKARGHDPKVPDPAEAKPEPKAQRNFTDPESRIMKDGATKSFDQAYNAQAVVDSTAQIIVAAGVTQDANDKNQLLPMLEKVADNFGELPKKISADAGYFSKNNVTDERLQESDLYIPPDRQKHGTQAVGNACDEELAEESEKARMRAKLRTPEGKEIYKMRKAIVEPVYGQVKEERGFRRFSFRGLVNVVAEWDLICLTHNILKLFRSGWKPAIALAT